MALSKHFESSAVERKWYQHWMEKGYFHSEPDEREPYTILIPPPNVTGVLHMGHMLNNTIQDILIRRARLQGKNACWVPGMDHASIATEAKVVKHLRSQGIKKSDLSREKFLEHAWAWKEEYGGIILEQLKRLGASCDWDRTAFTMDEIRSKAVIKVFVDLYKKDYLYRKLRMVNWDPEAKTVLSNEEVIYHNEKSKLYHVAYQIEGSDEKVVIATTRPETILGDTAIAVHPDDPRWTHLKGKRAIVPMVGRSIPIIMDDYVDMEFGTGALKVTPAHDVNDYEIGERHGLEVIDILNDDGTIAEIAGLFVGLDREVARGEAAKMLEESGELIKVEDLDHNVGRSERTNVVVEPKLSLQWYVDMPQLAKKAHEAVMTDEVEFFPKKQKNIYDHWMKNIRDWCISRQLWWGHRIPAWYYGEEVFVAETEEEALAAVREKHGANISKEDLRQDEDVLDTWFSSWLWPISVFDGFEDQKEIDYYYPANVIVTGWDIIFLWIARMIMAGYEWRGERPFNEVYFTGMVRDKQRRKMSKSLGNSPDALKLIDDYGADGVRFGMLSCSPAGGDLLFDEKLCEQGRNFSNKLWNALKLVKGWEDDASVTATSTQKFAIKWMNALTDETQQKLDDDFEAYRLSETLINLYTFGWTDFCSWFLESVKPQDGKINPDVKADVIAIFEKICILVHPFMPFLTEEIWHQLADRSNGDDLIIARYPELSGVDKDILKKYELLKDITSSVRDIRNKNQVKQSELLELFIQDSDLAKELMSDDEFSENLKRLATLSSVNLTDEEPANAVSFISDTLKLFVVLNLEIDFDAELERLEGELEYARGFVSSVEKKLSNERFVNNAPSAVVEKERQKMSDGQARIEILTTSIADIKKKMG